MSKEEDLAWLKSLHEELTRPGDQRTEMQRRLDEAFPGKAKPLPLESRERLTYEEVDRVCQIIEEHKLVTELYSCGMICGVGMAIYDHEVYPGSGTEKLLCLQEDHLPGPKPLSWQERLQGKPKPKTPKRRGGDCDPYAWELFTKYANRPENLAWLTKYKLQPVKSKMHYDY